MNEDQHQNQTAKHIDQRIELIVGYHQKITIYLNGGNILKTQTVQQLMLGIGMARFPTMLEWIQSHQKALPLGVFL